MGLSPIVTPELVSDWAAPTRDEPSSTPRSEHVPASNQGSGRDSDRSESRASEGTDRAPSMPVRADAGAPVAERRATVRRRVRPPLVRPSESQASSTDMSPQAAPAVGVQAPIGDTAAARPIRVGDVTRLRVDAQDGLRVSPSPREDVSKAGFDEGARVDGPRDISGPPTALRPMPQQLESRWERSTNRLEHERRAGRAEKDGTHSEEPNEVHITIGRVEVRAASPASTKQPLVSPPRVARAIALDDYLRQREGRRS